MAATTALGHTVIGKAAYTVHGLGPLSEAARAAGIVLRVGLEGPRGAWYLVTDYGPGFRLNVVAMGGGIKGHRSTPRLVDFVTREHLTLFYEGAASPLGTT